MLADAVGHREAGAAVHEALAADGGARDAVAAALVGADRADAVPRASPTASPRCSPSSTTSSPSCATSPRRIEEDPEQLAAVRARRQLLRDLCRKYGDDLAEVSPTSRRRRRAWPSWRATRSGRRSSTPSTATRWRPSARRPPGRAGSAAPRPSRSARRSPTGCASWRCRTPPSPSSVDDDDPAGEHVQFLLAANPGSPALPRRQGGVGRRAGAHDAGPAPRAHRARRRRRARSCSTRSTPASAGPRRRPSGDALAEVGRTPPGARRHPPRPGRRPGDDAGRRRRSAPTARRTTATAAVVDGRRAGSPSWPGCCRATRAATPPAATPSSCSAGAEPTVSVA